MSTAESQFVITEANAQKDAITALARIAPQPMKEVKLTSTNDWQYFYLEPVLSASNKTDPEVRGGPLAMMAVETNDVIMDFGLLLEGSEGLSNRIFSVGEIGSIPIFVARIAYKSAAADSAGVIRFYAPYDKDALQEMS